jgi:hypothetical protein
MKFALKSVAFDQKFGSITNAPTSNPGIED